MGRALPTYTAEEFRLAAARATLEEIREIALQSKLLALNTHIESAQPGETNALRKQAANALVEASRVVTAVDLLLQQINASANLVRH